MKPDDQPNMPSEDDSDAPVDLGDSSKEFGLGNAGAHLRDGMDANGDVRAENVTLSQGGARDIQATTVSITQGGAAQVHADQMSLSQGGAAIVHADSFTLNDGGTAFAVMADQATVNEGSNVLLLIAGEVNGDARPLLDWRSALALAGGLVIAWRLIRRIV
ncbi:MAG: hypothetical protein ABI744_04270 [Chloroflexota bacterium]